MAAAATRGESVAVETWSTAGEPQEGPSTQLSCRKAFNGNAHERSVGDLRRGRQVRGV